MNTYVVMYISNQGSKFVAGISNVITAEGFCGRKEISFQCATLNILGKYLPKKSKAQSKTGYNLKNFF
jgi:hypothetical protein